MGGKKLNVCFEKRQGEGVYSMLPIHGLDTYHNHVLWWERDSIIILIYGYTVLPFYTVDSAVLSIMYREYHWSMLIAQYM